MAGRKRTTTLLGRSLAHYRLVGQLGKGGMGEVYLAEDQRLHRKVALKILSADLAREPRHLERFQREARSVAALNHPNIVTIHAVESAKGLHFLVLELVEGETLADRLATAGPMPLDRLLAIALPLTEALEAAHGRGIVHRDLKPRNIMISREGRVKVLDFGIARLTRVDEPEEEDTRETGLTRTGGVVGTTAYMSPEQVQGQPVDRRSDLFSLGVILYEMATGRHPFHGKGQMALMASILYDTPPPPGTLVPSLPDRFDEIVGLCLAKEPFLRYCGAAELRRDLLELESESETTLFVSPAAPAVPPRPQEQESSSAAARRGTNPRLPARPRCFGRETEIRELTEALCSDPPPPTPVLGPAGAGKTTITLAALHERRVADLFGQRRWFIRCDGATGRDSLVGAIARVLCPEAVPPLEPKIFLDLEEGPAVLVLDNFETPWERETAAVEELLAGLAAIPGLALVVALRGKQRPFGPDWREAIHAGPLDPESARSTFLAVAGERYRDDPDLEPLLLDLDGLALAVVLLASQAEGEPDLMALRLRWQERRTALLRRAGARDRQQSLEVSLGLSIDSPRMTEEGRRLLSILGLLPEGIARQDLEPLLPGHGAEAAAVLRKVGLVFDQSSRLRMLAPVREHVRQSYPPQTKDFDRIVDHYLALARLGEKIGRTGGAEAAQRLRSEVGNLEPMILAGLERQDPEPAIRSAIAYAGLVRFTGLGGIGILESARRVAKDASKTELEAECLRKCAEIDRHRAHYDQALSLCKEAQALYATISDQRGQAFCIVLQGDIHLYRTEYEAASRLYDKARVLCRVTEDVTTEAYCLLGLGSAMAYQSKSTGKAQLEEARALFAQQHDALGEANCLQAIAHHDMDFESFDAAEDCLNRSLRLFRCVGSVQGEANSIRSLGYIALRRGNARMARSLCEKALALHRRVGSLLGEANSSKTLGDANLALFDHEKAEEFIRRARQTYHKLGQIVGEANCAASLGEIALAKTDTVGARYWFEAALSLYRQASRPVSMGRAHLNLAKSLPPGSPERLEQIEAAQRAWEHAGALDQMRGELEAAVRANTTSP